MPEDLKRNDNHILLKRANKEDFRPFWALWGVLL